VQNGHTAAENPFEGGASRLLSYLQYILLCGIGLYLGLLGYALAR